MRNIKVKLLYDSLTIGSDRSIVLRPYHVIFLVGRIERFYKIKILRRIGIGEALSDRRIVGP